MQRSWSLGFGFCLCIRICICICIRICIVCPLCVCVSGSVCLLLSHTLFRCFFVFRFGKFNAYLIWLFALWPSLRLLTLKLMSGGGNRDGGGVNKFVPAPEEANSPPAQSSPRSVCAHIYSAQIYSHFRRRSRSRCSCCCKEIVTRSTEMYVCRYLHGSPPWVGINTQWYII